MNTDRISEQQIPLISIGMPVRNEARFLEAALVSLVSQTSVSMEIIISDNASTDETENICKSYCERYPYIRYHRFDNNVGASANFYFVLQEARGRYFMWAAGHDLWEGNYLQVCCNALETTPSAVVAFGTARWIGADGAPLPRAWGWSDTRGLSLIGRYFTIFWGHMNPILGLLRMSELRRQTLESMVGVDLAILLGLVLHGDFIHVWQTGWFRREVRSETSYQQKLERYQGADYALSTSWVGRYFPLVRLPLRIFRDLFAAPVSFGSKSMIALILIVSLPVKYFVDKARSR